MNTKLYDQFFEWYKNVSQNMKDNDMDNEQISYLSWLEGRTVGIKEKYQYRQYIESLSKNKEGKFFLVELDDTCFIIPVTDVAAKNYLIIAAADNTKDLFAYASLKKILIYNANTYSAKTDDSAEAMDKFVNN